MENKTSKLPDCLVGPLPAGYQSAMENQEKELARLREIEAVAKELVETGNKLLGELCVAGLWSTKIKKLNEALTRASEILQAKP